VGGLCEEGRLADRTPGLPSRTRSGHNQDRHLMMPSPPIRHRIDTRHSGRSQLAAPPLASALQLGPQPTPPIWVRNASNERDRSLSAEYG